MTKYQGSTVPKRDSAAEQDHSLTLPAPPPSMAYQPVPTVRTPAPPLDPTQSGLHRAVQDWPPEESADPFDVPGRDTVPSPPPEDTEYDENDDDNEPAADE